TWVAASSATYGEGVLTVRIKSSPKAADVGKTIARTYSLTYDDVRDVVAKTEWIQEMGFGGGMYWEYSQDSTSRTEFDVKLPWEGLITETIYKGLNGPRSTVTQPARGSGGTSAVLQYGRKATPPVISYRYDKSLNATTNKYKEWDSRENMQSQLGTVAADADAGIATAYNNNKVRFFEGGLYVNASTPYHIYYGVLPVLAPAYATSGTYTPQSNSTLVRGNGYAWMQSRNSSYVANASAVGVSTPEWTFLKDFPSTRINRTEFNTPLRAPSNAALHVISANPSAKQVLPGTTVNYNIEVLGGSGNYTSVTHQVWFLGVKYDNNDGYRKTEKRRTGGPYPIPTGAGAGAQNSPAGGTGVDFKNEPGTALGLDRKVITSTVGETRATIVPSKTSGTGVVSFSTNEYGTYYIFTQVTDSTGKLAAQFSQPVEVTDVLDLDLQVTSTTNAGTGVNVNTVVTATGAATGAAAVGMEYKFEVFNGTTSVFTRDYAAGTTFNFTPTTEGTYKVKVTGKNSSGDEVSAISTSFLVTQPLTITSVTPTTANVGTSKLFTAVAIGGVGAKTYSYYVLKGGKVWASQAYTSNTTFNWTPTEAGTYRLRVYCQDEAVTRVVKEITVTVS
ncbi:MAG: hypothetical protein LBS74_01300, partial [Oscillospiraceae bacterium]|nr:hypothetical protein [Oscillospiraceae bacterium]